MKPGEDNKVPRELRKLLDRAIALVDHYVPLRYRQQPSQVAATAVSMLVAARAVVEAMIELEDQDKQAAAGRGGT